MKYIKMVTFLMVLICSFCYINTHSMVGEFNSEAEMIIPKEEVVLEETKLSLEDEYNNEDHVSIEDDLVDNIYNKISNEYKYISKDKIKSSFISANNRLSDKQSFTYNQYYSVVALVITTMEIESSFTDTVCYNNNGTSDYGVMQINSGTIPEIEEAIGDVDIKNSTKDNIEAGSWKIYECYKKALDKHFDKIIWWTYAYYNRGMYFENNEYNYSQANTRSNIFIEKYNKNYNMIIGEFEEKICKR